MDGLALTGMQLLHGIPLLGGSVEAFGLFSRISVTIAGFVPTQGGRRRRRGT